MTPRGIGRVVFATLLLAALVVVAILAGAAPATGQEWRVEAQGGRYQLEGSPLGSAEPSALLGLRYLQGESWAGVFGGIPLADGDPLLGIAAGRLKLFPGDAGGPVRAGLDLGAQLFGQREPGADEGPLGDGPLDRGPLGRGQRGPLDPAEPSLDGWGFSVEATPALRVAEGRALSGELRGGVAWYRADFADEAFERTAPLAEASLSWRPGPELLLQGRGTAWWADEDRYPFAGVTALTVRGPVTAWGEVGRWFHDDVETVPWSVGAMVEVSDRLSLTASVREDAFDPLYATPARTSWSVGVSVVLAAPPGPRAPVPEAYDEGVATVALDADDARGEPRIAGDFNGWTPEPMTRNGDRWLFRARVDPGVYNYAFVTADGEWYVPDSVAGRKDDGFGGHTAVLVVE